MLGSGPWGRTVAQGTVVDDLHARAAPDRTASLANGVAYALQRCPLLAHLGEADLELLLQGSRATRPRPGGRLLRASDDLLAVVLQGVAISRAPTRAGVDVVTGFAGAGETVGLTQVLGRSGVGCDVTALTSVTSLLLPGPQVRHAANRRHPIAQALLRATASQLAELQLDASDLVGTSTRERVVLRLLRLVDRFGVPGPTGLRIALPLTQDDLASWARASRESTARALHALRESEVIATARREITVLDLEALRRRGRSPDERGVELLLH